MVGHDERLANPSCCAELEALTQGVYSEEP